MSWPGRLAGFSNKLLLEEVRIYYPIWFTVGEVVVKNGPDMNPLHKQ